MSLKDKKILVLTSCSLKKRKSKEPLKANELYKGDFFMKVRDFAFKYDFDLKIISAKYALIDSDEKISFYNVRIKNQEDIERLRKMVGPKIKKIEPLYDKILLIMGEDYKKIIEPFRNDKFLNFFDNRGLGGYKALMKDLLSLTERNLYKLLFSQNNKEINNLMVKNFIYKKLAEFK